MNWPSDDLEDREPRQALDPLPVAYLVSYESSHHVEECGDVADVRSELVCFDCIGEAKAEHRGADVEPITDREMRIYCYDAHTDPVCVYCEGRIGA